MYSSAIKVFMEILSVLKSSFVEVCGVFILLLLVFFSYVIPSSDVLVCCF